ncbi:small-conductance mechanosensitive channel [Paenibacillus sp. HJGM_3]|uniref:small-conductance mechanosensitive channel n=1 Tax=Paenibacillus sp. HJGM_3 TaxID=3379816 RepID=UPI00385FF09A
MKKTIFLILTFSLIFLLPLAGSLLKWGGLPPGYGEFPAQEAVQDPGFNATYFFLACLVGLFIAVFLLFPSCFGFKKTRTVSRMDSVPVPVHAAASPQALARLETASASTAATASAIARKAKLTPSASTGYPLWFWWSLPVLAISWFLTWSRAINSLEHYTFVPLWWSFILILDGFVYKRNAGISLLSSKPNTMKLLAVVSCFSWFAIEYLNFFVMENWYYPNEHIFTNFGNIFWFSLSYTTVLPAIIEWYLLLQTLSFFRDRYSYGPKLTANRPMLIVFYAVGLALAFGMGYWPFELFWVLWVALIPLLSAAMGLLGYWTPFTPLGRGNWSRLLLIAIATLFNGFFWEMWNFGSEWFHDSVPTNPNYWKYSVPYLDKIHIYSEMPILGYYGYLFFGVNCWVIWLTGAYVFKYDPGFELRDARRED